MFLKLSHVAMKMMKTGKTIRHITILYVHYVGRHRHSSVRIIASPASVSVLIIHWISG